MRFRTLLLIALMLLLAGFVALNFEAVMQMTNLNLGFAEIQAPLGLVMLGLLVIMFAVFLVALLYFQAAHAVELRKVTKEASEQRHLADKAEASRFTELRAFVQSQQVQSQEAFMARLDALETHLMARAQESDNSAAAYIGQLEQQIGRAPRQG